MPKTATRFAAIAGSVGYAALIAGIITWPSAPRDPDFKRIALPAGHAECLPQLFRSASTPSQPFDAHLTAEDRNAGKLNEKLSEAQVAVAVHRWLTLREDENATPEQRNAALADACTAGRNVRGDFPDFQIMGPLTSLGMGDDRAMSYDPAKYETHLLRVQAEVAGLQAKALQYMRERFSQPASPPPQIVRPSHRVAPAVVPLPPRRPGKRSDAAPRVV